MAAINLDDITSIVIGRVGENDAVSIQFDYSEWIAEFGTGTITMNFLRPTEDVPYPVSLTAEDGIATWLVSSIDTAISGVGQAQFVYTVDSVIKKSRVLSAIILKSIGMNGQVPDPYDAWLAEMQEIAQLTVGYGELAHESSETAVSASETAVSAKDTAVSSAQSASQDAQSASASASSASTDATSASNSATSASGSATSANTNALKSEGYAVGKQNGTDVESGSPYYHNNAEYFASQANTSAQNAEHWAEELSGSILHFADPNNDGNVVITSGGTV